MTTTMNKGQQNATTSGTRGIASVNARINSSFIERVNYNRQTRSLIVTFATGIKYIYEDVPVSIACQLLMAESSAGSIYNQEVKGRFQWYKV